MYKFEEEILATMAKVHTSKYEARQIVLGRTPQYRKLYSDAIKSRQNITYNTETTSNDKENENLMQLETSVISAEVHHRESS